MAAIIGEFFAVLFTTLFTALRKEISAWMPRVIERIIVRSVNQLPVDWQEPFGKKWRNQVAEVPGEIGKLLYSCWLFPAAVRIAPRLTLGAPGVPVALKITINTTLPSLRVQGVGQVSNP